LTVPFRSVEQYLAKLQLCAEALRDSSSLAILYLAAAVSDFYVPSELKSEHKIQSGGKDGLVLELKPVPKVMGLLRESWAPDAFVASFKLETDKDILRQKAEGAVEKYNVHMVIGNLLK
jgi:phosphopantothenate-cysteine ligase